MALSLKELNDKRFEGKSIDDYVICEECGLKCVNVSLHVRRSHSPHSVEDYRICYPDAPLWPRSYIEAKRIAAKSESNPFRNHGGKYSPFSKLSGRSEEAIEESKRKASENRTHTTRLDYWVSMGLSLDESKKRLKERQTTFSKEKLILRHGPVVGLEMFHSRQIRWLDTLLSRYSPEELYRLKIEGMERAGTLSKVDESFVSYKSSVGAYTKKSVSEYIDVPNRGRTKGKNHLDHIFSILCGYLCDVPPFIIGSVINLQVIPGTTNSSKKSRCDISEEELYARFKGFITECRSKVYRDFIGRRLSSLDRKWMERYKEFE